MENRLISTYLSVAKIEKSQFILITLFWLLYGQTIVNYNLSIAKTWVGVYTDIEAELETSRYDKD